MEAKLSPATIQAGLRASRFGRPLSVYPRVDSTNDIARELAEQGASEGTAVIAREQTGGRGRLGRPWISPPGGLWLSVVLRPTLPVAQWPLLGFAGSVGAATAVEAIAGVTPQLKWPNDLVIDDRKLGGVLIEAGPAYAIAGIGINANVGLDALSSETTSSATTLLALRGQAVDLNALAREVLLQVERAYDLLYQDVSALIQQWRGRSVILGRHVGVSGTETFEGIAENVDAQGALLVRTPTGLRRVVVGDVSLRAVEVPP